MKNQKENPSIARRKKLKGRTGVPWLERGLDSLSEIAVKEVVTLGQ
jgi:hypothetical protein